MVITRDRGLDKAESEESEVLPVVIGAGAPAVLTRLKCDLTRSWRLAICKENRGQRSEGDGL